MIILLPYIVEQELLSSIFQMNHFRVKGGNYIPRGCIIYCLDVCKMISMGCLYHIVRVHHLDFEISPTESVPVVSEFLEVFPNVLLGIPFE